MSEPFYLPFVEHNTVAMMLYELWGCIIRSNYSFCLVCSLRHSLLLSLSQCIYLEHNHLIKYLYQLAVPSSKDLTSINCQTTWVSLQMIPVFNLQPSLSCYQVAEMSCSYQALPKSEIRDKNKYCSWCYFILLGLGVAYYIATERWTIIYATCKLVTKI